MATIDAPGDEPRVDQNEHASQQSRLTWGVAAVGALSALLGALIGAGASVVVAFLGFENDEDAAVRTKQEEAYLGFLREVRTLEYQSRYSGLKLDSKTTVDRVTQAETLVWVYGSKDARDATGDVMDGLVDGIVNAEKLDEDVKWESYDDAMASYLVAIREDLDVE